MTRHDHQDKIRALLNEAGRMPNSLGKFDVLDEAVRLADLHNDLELGVAARLPLIAVAGSLLRGDAMAVHFTWCLHRYDARPDLFAGRNLFWEYRTLVGRLANFDAVSRAQLEEMLADYTARLAREGHGPAMALSAQLLLGPDLGDPAMSVAAMDDLRRRRLESVVTTAAERFQHEVFIGNDAGAMRIAEAELIAPTRAGRNAPFDMNWNDLFALLWRLGRGAEVPKWLGRAERQTTIRDCYYWPFGKVVTALTLVGRLDDAVKVAGQCQRAIREYTDPLTLLHFCLDLSVLFDRLHAVGREAVLVRFADGPHAPPGLRPNGKYAVAEVRDWLHRQAAELAARFDRRNGTAYFTGLIRDRAGMQRFAVPTGSEPEV